jgi:hypothetical protein
MGFGWIAAAAEKLEVTGVLALRDETVVKQFYYDCGDVIFVSSSKPGERFGEFLAERGCFDRSRMLDLVKDAQRRNVRFTSDLLSEGVLKKPDLEAALRELILVAMTDALDWDEGLCQFEEGLPPGVMEGPVTIRVENTLGKALALARIS